MRTAVKLMLINGDKKFMGPGIKVLLERIDELSSIKAAAAAMGMSYTKSLRILRDMETELGFEVVISEKGGYNRGGSKLTEKGKKILASYQSIERAVAEYAQRLVESEFKI